MSTDSLISADLAIVGRTSRARMPSPSVSIAPHVAATKPRPKELEIVDYARVYAARCGRIAASSALFAFTCLLLVRYATPYSEAEWSSEEPRSQVRELLDILLRWTEGSPLVLMLTGLSFAAIGYVGFNRRAWTRFERSVAQTLHPLRRARQLTRAVDETSVLATIVAGATSSVYFATLRFALAAHDTYALLAPESEVVVWPAPDRYVIAQRDVVMLVLLAGVLVVLVAAVIISSRVRRWSSPSMLFGTIAGALLMTSVALAGSFEEVPLFSGIAVSGLFIGALAATSGLVLAVRRSELKLLEDDHA